MPDEPQLGQRRAVRPSSLAHKFNAPPRSESLRGLIAPVATDSPPNAEVVDQQQQQSADELRLRGRDSRRERRVQPTGSANRTEARPAPDKKASSRTRRVEVKTTEEQKRQLDEVARLSRTSVTAVIFKAIDELHSELPTLLTAQKQARADAAAAAAAGRLFPRRQTEDAQREPRAVITMRAANDEVETMDQLVSASGAENRSAMINGIVAEWLERHATEAKPELS